ncbi:MAG TPA: hypothetical protein VIC35_08075 [Acidimicrobiia bacterium]|jgi:hypothetical protein
MQPLLDLLGFQQFQTGLLVGLVALIIGAIFANELRARGRRVPGVVGPLWVLASLVALSGSFWLPKVVRVPWALPIGLILLFAGGELAAANFPKAAREFPYLPSLIAAVPGAALVAWSANLNRAGWTPWFIFLGTIFGSVLIGDFDERTTRLGISPWLWAISLVGMYVNLADTELIRVLLGAAIPLVLLGWPLRIGRLGDGGSAAAAGLFLWVIAFEGPARPLQVWLLFALFGLLILEPFGRIVGTPRRKGFSDNMGRGVLRWMIVLVHGVIVMYVARYVGFSERFPGDSWYPLMLLFPALFLGAVFSHYMWLGPKLRMRSRIAPRERERPAERPREVDLTRAERLEQQQSPRAGQTPRTRGT